MNVMERWYVALLALGLAVIVAVLAIHRFEPGRIFEIELSEGESAEVCGSVLVLEDFSVLKYPSGLPRQFESQVRILRGESERSRIISVNHPFRLDDVWIYQQSYDPIGERTTVLKVVHDRWLWLAAAGGVLLLAGAFLGLFAEIPLSSVQSRRVCRFLAGALTVLLPVFIIGRIVLRPEPPPALQSVLLAPHVAAYAASFMVLLFAAFGIGRRYVPLGFLLMTNGLIIGAIWGKICWGDWWQYDPKEMWSFATWLVYAAYLPLARHRRLELSLRIAGAVLIVLTLTWVNFSRLFSGLHSY